MPYISEKAKLQGTKYDSRVKLTIEDKKVIRDRYLNGDISMRVLAREYGVSRRSIQFAVYPERQEKNYQNRLDRGGSAQYYDKDKNTESMKKHRRRKGELFKEGKIK